MYFSELIISWKNADRVYDSDKAKQMSLFGEGEGSNFFQGSKPKWTHILECCNLMVNSMHTGPSRGLSARW